MPARRSGSPSQDKLTSYRAKRDFAKTPEPSGSTSGDQAGARRFVVQRHRASRLHYDFRLELDGVLVSWAVPKGPTLDAGVRRGAFHVEDHPLEYFDFEGVIPSGEYGGGDVIVWDAGTWLPYKSDNPQRELAKGELHAELHGEKLHGRFVLVRTNEDKDEWLLLHKHDEFAVTGWDAEDHPKSVLSGRTNDEVKADPERMWRSDLPAARAAVLLKPSAIEPASDAALAALAELPDKGTWQIFGRELRLTALDTVLFAPRTKRGKPVTKRDLLAYAAVIAPTALPYVRRRTLTLHRYPHGMSGATTRQRAVPRSAPDWLPRWTDADGRTWPVADEPAALVWAAAVNALEWHVSTYTVDRPDRPTHAVLELHRRRWSDVLVLARLYRTALEHIGVPGGAKTTGQHGLEIWIPTEPGPSFDELVGWATRLSETVAGVVPDLADGAGPSGGTTVLAPYSPVAAPGAPVSTPVGWAELDDARFKPDRWTIRNIRTRLAERGDPFADIRSSGKRLPKLAAAE